MCNICWVGRYLRIVVCACEAPCLIAIGVLLALGQYGPMVLPLHVHLAFTHLWSEVTTPQCLRISTIVCACEKGKD